MGFVIVLEDTLKALENALNWAVGVVWNYPVVFGCLGAALFFTVVLGFVQFRGFFHALGLISGKYDKPGETGHITHFQALTAALSGTVGLGNISGVAIAIAMGGPGAIFWMWLTALLGMATKYGECGLATIYREKFDDGKDVRGGTMYFIKNGIMPRFKRGAWLWMFLAGFYGFAGAFASLGAANMFQSNQASRAVNEYFPFVAPWMTGLALAIGTALVIIGGIRVIGKVASKIVPLMCGIYILGALFICLANITEMPHVMGVILSDAFSGEAAAGGVIGTVIIWGVRRAVFSNELGKALVITFSPSRGATSSAMRPDGWLMS